jgi:hypothetical protein
LNWCPSLSLQQAVPLAHGLRPKHRLQEAFGWTLRMRPQSCCEGNLQVAKADVLVPGCLNSTGTAAGS